MARKSQNGTGSYAWSGFIVGILFVVVVCAFLHGGSQHIPVDTDKQTPQKSMKATDDGGSDSLGGGTIRPEALTLQKQMATDGDIHPRVIEVKSYAKFYEAIKKVEDSPDLFVLFLADTDPETGRSWCPDTARADPIIMDLFKNLKKSTTLVRVYVGDRPTWKSANNPYRTDPKIAISSVPTFMRWRDGPVEGSVLGDSEASVVDLLQKVIG